MASKATSKQRRAGETLRPHEADRSRLAKLKEQTKWSFRDILSRGLDLLEEDLRRQHAA
ncbi:MAG: hypothetical protein AAFY08_14455 [Planctomycetota bacterium]